MTGHPKAKHKSTTFERKAGAMPSLQRAAARPPADLGDAQAAGGADDTADTPVPGFLSHKEVILRLVETLKAL